MVASWWTWTCAEEGKSPRPHDSAIRAGAGRRGDSLKSIRLVLVLALFVAPLAVEAQPTSKVYRIGWLHPVPIPAEWLEGFRQGLRDFGYVEGRDLLIDYQWGDGRFDRLPAMAAEMVRRNPDVIIAGNTEALRALKTATSAIPIVMLGPGDAVGAGIITNLARPGGNITGLTQIMPEVAGKRLELLKEVVPEIRRVTVLSNPGNRSVVLELQATGVAAKRIGLGLQSIDVREPAGIEPALSAISRDRPDALLVLGDSMIHTKRTGIAEFAVKHRLPSVSPWREFAEAGGLMVYGVSVADIFRRSVGYLDKIFKGARPGDLPVEQPVRFELIINLKTARALGLIIPPSVLLRTDEVIQ